MKSDVNSAEPQRFARFKQFLRASGVLSAAAIVAIFVVTLTGAVDNSVAPVEVQLLDLQPSTFSSEIERKGVIEPLHSDAVHSDCYWSTTILSLIPEGTWVQKGDIVCVLDSADIEEYAKTRELLLIKYRARLDAAIQDQSMLKSENARRLDAARFKHQTAAADLKEYQEATFPQTVAEAERRLSLLADEAQTATDDIRHTERLWAMGLTSRGEMARTSLNLQKALQKQDVMQAQLDLLTEYSHPRDSLRLQHTESQAARNVARTRLTGGLAMTKSRLTTLSYERTLRIYETYYRRAIDSIEACTLRAPCDGQVVYANSWSLMSRGITQIEIGAKVRREQKVFEIPDPSRMKVSVPLDESLIYQVENGMPVAISLPAHEDEEIAGRVISIARYPRPRSYYTPQVKDYWLDIELLPTPEQKELLHAKADVEVQMTLNTIPDTLQIPRSAITGVAGHNFVYVYEDSELKARPVDLGTANEESVIVSGGLEFGEQLVSGMLPEHKVALDAKLREDLGIKVTDE